MCRGYEIRTAAVWGSRICTRSRAAADLHFAAGAQEGNGITATLEIRHAALVHRHRLDQVERLGQELRQRPQERLLRLPARRHGQPGHRADPLQRAGRPVGVGPRLEAGQAVEVPAPEVQALAVAHAAFRLSLLFGRTDLTCVDMKTHRAGIDTVLFVDLSPGTAAVRDARLEVVDAIDRRDAAEPAVGLVVHVVPGELVHGPAPDDGLLATVAEDHDEGVDGGRSLRVAEVDAAELAPVALCLRPGWGLDPAERADRGPAVARPHELAHRLVRPVVAVLGAEEFVEELDAGRPLWAEDLDLGLPPVVDDLDQAELRDPRGLLPAIGGSVAGAAEVVPDRPLGNAQEPRRLAVGLASLLQDLDRHELLPRAQRARTRALARTRARATRGAVCKVPRTP